MRRTVEQILYRNGSDVIGAAPATTVREAVRRMIEADVSCLLVEQRPDVFGIFTERDLARRVVAAGKDPSTTHLAEVMSSPVYHCTPSDTVEQCLRAMAERHIRHLAVFEDGKLVGVLTLRDLLPA